MDMTQEIIRALAEGFPGMEVYGESLEQGFSPPCFGVHLLDSATQVYPGDRVLWQMPYDLRFFPTGEAPNAQCRQMAPQMAQALATVAGVRARGINWQIIDGVLHFFATYAYFEHNPPAEVAMGALQVESGVMK